MPILGVHAGTIQGAAHEHRAGAGAPPCARSRRPRRGHRAGGGVGALSGRPVRGHPPQPATSACASFCAVAPGRDGTAPGKRRRDAGATVISTAWPRRMAGLGVVGAWAAAVLVWLTALTQARAPREHAALARTRREAERAGTLGRLSAGVAHDMIPGGQKKHLRPAPAGRGREGGPRLMPAARR